MHLQDSTSPPLCQCGCGGEVSIIRWADKSRGYIAGQPFRFLKGHSPYARKVPAAERFWFYLSDADLSRCWVWTGSRHSEGYGALRVDGHLVPAHRFAYEMLRGPIPPGYVLDHLCHTPLCVHPGHLEPVPQRINVLRGDGLPARRAAQTHCVYGHPLSGANLYQRTPTRRVCRSCHYAANRARAARRRAEAAP